MISRVGAQDKEKIQFSSSTSCRLCALQALQAVTCGPACNTLSGSEWVTSGVLSSSLLRLSA